MEKLKESIEQKAIKVGIDSELDQESDMRLKVSNLIQKQPPPLIEWWDLPYVKESYSQLKADEDKLINNYIHHPVPIQPKFERGNIKPRQIILTKTERKKIRRKRRMDALKEKQEKQKLGLLPPDEPKLKISNMIKVFTDEAIQDPTQIEEKVRKEIEKRKQKHEEQNKERKLTKQEKQAKKHKKYIQDIKQNGLFCMVFKVGNFRNMQHRYKVDVNAQEMNLTGLLIINSRFSLVLVEGPSKPINRYRKLMLRRIKWDELSTDETIIEEENLIDDKSQDSVNYCSLIWEGDIKERAFKGFKISPCPTENKIREVLGKGKNDHFWDLAKTFKSGDAFECLKT